MQNLDPCVVTEVALARDILSFLKPKRRDSYNDWFRTGAALKSISDSLFADFVLWSMPSPKYEGEGDCREKWDSFSRGSMETLVRMGREDGWVPESEKPRIIIDTNEDRVIADAVKAIGNRDDVYQRANLLVRICNPTPIPKGIARDPDPLRIEVLQRPTIREKLAASATFLRETKDGLKPAHIADWITAGVEAQSTYLNRTIEAITEVPALRADGSIIRQPGFDVETGAFYAPTVSVPKVDCVDEALKELLALLVDFQFAGEAHKSAFLAMLLTPLARLAVYGPSPLHLIDSNTPGSGKLLLVNLISLISCGRLMPVSTAPESDAECRKQITAKVIAGESIYLFDNIASKLAYPSLDAALTAANWCDRILGVSTTVTLPMRLTFFGTGNNISIHRDTLRRTNYCRLESTVENPETRSGFKIPHLLQHVRERRGFYTACALALLQGYCQAKRPDQHLSPLGSFEGWNDLVRSAVVWCGLPDPMDTRAALAATSDSESDALRQLLAGWQEADVAGHGLTAAEAVAMTATCPTLKAAIDALEGGKDWKHAIGLALRKYRGRICGGLSFVKTERGKTSVWKVQK